MAEFIKTLKLRLNGFFKFFHRVDMQSINQFIIFVISLKFYCAVMQPSDNLLCLIDFSASLPSGTTGRTCVVR